MRLFEDCKTRKVDTEDDISSFVFWNKMTHESKVVENKSMGVEVKASPINTDAKNSKEIKPKRVADTKFAKEIEQKNNSYLDFKK